MLIYLFFNEHSCDIGVMSTKHLGVSQLETLELESVYLKVNKRALAPLTQWQLKGRTSQAPLGLSGEDACLPELSLCRMGNGR